MKIALTSKNQAKIQAVTNVFAKVFDENIQVVSRVVESGISETPLNDEEALRGCRRRMQQIDDDDFNYIVSLEGLVQKFSYGWFLYGIAVVVDCQNKHEAIGCSAKVQIPDKIAQSINADKKLSDLVKHIYSEDITKDLDLIGTNGVITNGLFTRVDEFDGALKCALGYVINKENYV